MCSGTDTPSWPPAGIHTFDPFHLPFLNTMILLLSGTTITWAHHSLHRGRPQGPDHRPRADRPPGAVIHDVPGHRVFRRAVQVLGRRRVSVRVLPRDRLSRLSRDRRHLLPDRVPAARQRAASSRRSGISVSKPRLGIGTSSTWCGCFCSSASIGGAHGVRRGVSREPGRAQPPSVLVRGARLPLPALRERRRCSKAC